MSTHNGEVVRRWVEEMWNGRQPSLCDQLMAEEFIEHAHAPFSEDEPGRVHGPQTMRASMDWLLAQFPDLVMEIQQLVSEGDLVAVRVVSSGTNSGPLNGVVPATGRAIRSEQTHWFRLDHGRIAEHWATRDDLTSMLQLGVVGRPGRPAGAPA